ncbi:MAG TPA: hypothetical protein VN847_24015 [Streptosporangiaceae bacterium]|nr:hypothetical protein [Streptosporangiaceae bacterium]
MSLFTITVSDWSLLVHAVKPGAATSSANVKVTGTASPLPHSRSAAVLEAGEDAPNDDPSDAEYDGAPDPPVSESGDPDDDEEHAATNTVEATAPAVSIVLIR